MRSFTCGGSELDLGCRTLTDRQVIVNFWREGSWDAKIGGFNDRYCQISFPKTRVWSHSDVTMSAFDNSWKQKVRDRAKLFLQRFSAEVKPSINFLKMPLWDNSKHYNKKNAVFQTQASTNIWIFVHLTWSAHWWPGEVKTYSGHTFINFTQPVS